MKTLWKALVAGALLTALNAWPAWPERPVRLIVPFPAGQATDLYARFMAQRLEVALKQPFVVENVAGAGSTLGTEKVVREAPDGHTLLLTANAMAISQTLYPRIRYDARKDLDAIATVTTGALVLLTHPGSGITSLEQLMAAARLEPGKLMYASAGVGGSQHLATEMFKLQAGLDIVHIPYKGSTPAQADLLGGRIPLMMDSLAAALPNIRAGKVVPLAVTSAQRAIQVPQVPALAEAGLPGYEAVGWSALLAPRGTPPEVLDRLNREVRVILDTPEAQALFNRTGSLALPMSRPDATRFIAREIDKWGDAVRRTGATAD